MMNRREFLKNAGALVVSFSLPLPALAAAAPAGKAAHYPPLHPDALDGWLAVAPDGYITVYCGKVELGTGIRTALAQMVAEELDAPFDRISMLMGDTDHAPNQGPTAGSQSVYAAGPQLRQAAARARQALMIRASQQLDVPAARLTVADGIVSAPDGRRLRYADLVGATRLDETTGGEFTLKTPDRFKVIGKPLRRVELPDKVFGTHAYLHNLRLKDMRHGRVVRSPQPGAKLAHVDTASVAHLPGNVRVLVKGNFVGVVADREEQAVQAARQLKVAWKPAARLPEMEALPAHLRSLPARTESLEQVGDVDGHFKQAARLIEASYAASFQSHGSIGPSVAVADVRADRATLWSPSQSSFLTRDSVATLLGLPPGKVRLIWVEGSGCYGQNGADDATADAALLSQLAGCPVRVQWMRQDEHGNDPKGAAMAMTMRASLDRNGDVVAWENQVWSPNHNGRPFAGAAGQLLAGEALGLAVKVRPVGAERNARISYAIPNRRSVLHLLQSTPLRVSAMRGLGSPNNTFANESFMDELAAAAGADPVEYRLRHLKDPRAIAVLNEVARMSGWTARPAKHTRHPSGEGRGVAFVQYDNYAAYVAVVVDVKVDKATGKVRADRVYVAHDCGLIVNPDGLRNQIEGNVVQALSRALLEEVKFDRDGVTSLDWSSYPILRFEDVPRQIEIALVNRPDLPALGAGEATSAPICAAVANAIFDATGVRLRHAPFSAERVLAALNPHETRHA